MADLVLAKRYKNCIWYDWYMLVYDTIVYVIK